MELKILFLGASKRVSLLERFMTAAQARNISLRLFSCELVDDFYPISKYATILQGPRFRDPHFFSWLSQAITQHQIDIVIPNMDAATVMLSQYVQQQADTKAWCVVSEADLCLQCEDKIFAHQLFKRHHLPVVSNTPHIFPKIMKLRNGFGGRFVHIVKTAQEMQTCLTNLPNPDDYLIEDLLVGQETTTDMYFNRAGELMGYVLRDRLEISDGEVMVCITRDPQPDEKKLLEQVANIPGWMGCINVQFMRNRAGTCSIIEINPRFGGGSTAAIEAGLDMCGYILDEYLQRPFAAKPPILQHIKMTRARRDFFVTL